MHTTLKIFYMCSSAKENPNIADEKTPTLPHLKTKWNKILSLSFLISSLISNDV